MQASLFLVACLCAASLQASVSCNPMFIFLGYSVDSAKAYWEQQTSGDCDEEWSLWEYDFASRKNNLVRAVNKTEGEDINFYLREKQRTTQRLIFPQSFTWEDRRGKHLKADFTHYPLVQMDKNCRLGAPEFELAEDGQYAAVNVTAAYYNRPYDAWVVITAHHYSANACNHFASGQCPRNQALRIYSAGQCR